MCETVILHRVSNTAITTESGLPDLGLYPQILGIFKGDGTFLGIYFSRKPWDKSWDFRNSTVLFFLFVFIACLI